MKKTTIHFRYHSSLIQISITRCKALREKVGGSQFSVNGLQPTDHGLLTTSLFFVLGSSFFVLCTKAITDLVERNREDSERMRPPRITRILRMRSLGFLIRDIGVIRGQMNDPNYQY